MVSGKAEGDERNEVWKLSLMHKQSLTSETTERFEFQTVVRSRKLVAFVGNMFVCTGIANSFHCVSYIGIS